MFSRHDLLWQNYAYYFYAEEYHLDSVQCSTTAVFRKRYCNVNYNFKNTSGTVYFLISKWLWILLEIAEYRKVSLDNIRVYCQLGYTYFKYNPNSEILHECQAAKGSLCIHRLPPTLICIPHSLIPVWHRSVRREGWTDGTVGNL